MPARIPITERRCVALPALPDSERMVMRLHGLDANGLMPPLIKPLP